MKCNLITQLNEVTIRDYSLIEDEGLNALVAGSAGMGNPGLILSYEDDEETRRNMIVIKGSDLTGLLKFLDFAEIQVRIMV